MTDKSPTNPTETLTETENRIEGAILADIDEGILPNQGDGPTALHDEYIAVAAVDPAFAARLDAEIAVEAEKVATETLGGLDEGDDADESDFPVL